VLRRFHPIAAAAIALMVPTLGGSSDVSHASSASLDGHCSVGEPAATPPEGAAGACWLSHPSADDGGRALGRPPTHPRELLLSFDDGPDLRGTPLILDELDRRGLKAIFFVTGWRLSGDKPEDFARRALVRKIASHGHLVANHTMTHKNLCANPNEQADEIDEASEIVAQSTGLRPLLFRSPYGVICRSLVATLEARDLPNVRWNLDPQDWKSDDEGEIFRYLTQKLSHIEGRGILLLHDTHLASVNVLPAILDWIARENHRALRESRPPITLVDYSVLLPERPAPASGLETIVANLALDAGAAVGRLGRLLTQ
jgi:peptidoglycan/xylan/chitin deacetylase (PgdA/CDA1 family)